MKGRGRAQPAPFLRVSKVTHGKVKKMTLIKITALAIAAVVALLFAAVAILVVPLVLPESRPYLRAGFARLRAGLQQPVAREGLGD